MRIARARIRATICLTLVFVLAGVAGCGGRPANQAANNPVGQTPGLTLPGQPRPEPWVGQGLATPYINNQGELELAYADARGTVKLGGGKGRVIEAALAPDRQQLVYAVSLAGSDEQPIYYLDASAGEMNERLLPEARDNWPVGRLAWSPCSQYLAIDSGTSAAVRPLLVLKPASGEVIGSCQAFGFVWSPAAPSRLVIARVSSRQLMPVTELDRTTDLILVDLPSRRLTTLASGGTVDCWGAPEWTAESGLKVQHSFMDYRENMDETLIIDVPARSATADSVPAIVGALPAGAAMRAEVDFGGQLLLVDGDGDVAGKLTDARHGRVINAATTADGSIIAYAWLAEGERVVRIKTVRLADLTTGEIDLVLSDADRKDAPIGFGPQQLAFAQDHTLLVNFHGWRPDDRVQAYDADTGRLLHDGHLWMPLWAPGPRTSPLLVAGALTDGSSDPAGVGAALSLVQIDTASGDTTVIRQGSKTESWWPLVFTDPGHVICLRVATDPATGRVKVEEVSVELPQ